MDAITADTRPCTKKQLQQFLGLVGYYSHSIRGFATLVATLMDRLVKQSSDYLQWDPTAIRAFETLRKAFTKTPELVSPVFTKPL